MPEEMNERAAWTRDDYNRARKIKEELEVTVYGPAGPDTDDCAGAWKLALMLKVIEDRLSIDLIEGIR
jgi:hypothetical protein